MNRPHEVIFFASDFSYTAPATLFDHQEDLGPMESQGHTAGARILRWQLHGVGGADMGAPALPLVGKSLTSLPLSFLTCKIRLLVLVSQDYEV